MLKELARGAVIAERAECPAMLLHTCAQLRNFFDELPAAVECTLTYGRFEAMPRASQADPPDPPPAIVPALWKPLARASQALLSLLGQLHGGLPLGGRDPFALALAGPSAGELAGLSRYRNREGRYFIFHDLANDRFYATDAGGGFAGARK